ncbi:YdcF family protein [Vitiosangium sp. GDMCC 1.1324]|uniref:YdcF family protein n=1 Tax=Vitiosangium sp. (strain GDMCC 1.1324) TaxID=2138576 RepID=UPI000D3A2E8B|nr:YdcF family protein [Vitiosangium sp. GDMCC 1.1324]PTL77156.1 YdcF family protein [Vitiosangium sp. GDMCC 1.1324]
MPPLALRKGPGPVRRWLYVGLGVATFGLYGMAFVVDRFGQRERAVPSDVLVVLGARVLPGGEPSSALRARVEKAVALYRQGLAPRLLFSGGVGVNPPSEAQVMRELALRLGVPSEACLLEERSHSTEQNARFSSDMLRSLGARRVVVVSDPYHLLRARQYFRLHGFEVATSPAFLSDRNLRTSDRIYWTVREAIALLLHPHVLLAREPS